jgi:uncharacterized protein
VASFGQSLYKPSTEADCGRKESEMRVLRPLFLLLVIVGGVNWLLVGLFKFDLVAAITGNTFGETNAISSVIYVLVGIAAIGLLPTLVEWVSSSRERAIA